MSRHLAMAIVLCLGLPAAGFAQVRPTTAPPQSFGVRGFADVGTSSFTAQQSFEAVLGSRTGTLFGGGAEVVLPQGLFASVHVSRFQKDGERVFVFDDEVFRLGIDTTVRVTPIEVTGGYRLPLGARVVPYLGGGLGWHHYQETSEFDTDDENVDETHRGYHLLGGVEARVARWFGVRAELQWTTVPDALGQDADGASAAFDETNLGGVAFRVRFVVGR